MASNSINLHDGGGKSLANSRGLTASSSGPNSSSNASSRAAGLALLRSSEELASSTPSTEALPSFSRKVSGMSEPQASGPTSRSTPSSSPGLPTNDYVGRADYLRRQREELELLHQAKLKVVLDAQEAKDEQELESILAADGLLHTKSTDGLTRLPEPQSVLSSLQSAQGSAQQPLPSAHPTVPSIRPSSSNALSPKSSSPKVSTPRATTPKITSPKTATSKGQSFMSNNQNKDKPPTATGKYSHVTAPTSHVLTSQAIPMSGKPTSADLAKRMTTSEKEKSPPMTSVNRKVSATSTTSPLVSPIPLPLPLASSGPRHRHSAIETLSLHRPATGTPHTGDEHPSRESTSIAAKARDSQPHSANAIQTSFPTPTDSGPIGGDPGSPAPSGTSVVPTEVSLRAVLASASERHVAASLNIPSVNSPQMNPLRSRASFVLGSPAITPLLLPSARNLAKTASPLDTTIAGSTMATTVSHTATPNVSTSKHNLNVTTNANRSSISMPRQSPEESNPGTASSKPDFRRRISTISTTSAVAVADGPRVDDDRDHGDDLDDSYDDSIGLEDAKIQNSQRRVSSVLGGGPAESSRMLREHNSHADIRRDHAGGEGSEDDYNDEYDDEEVRSNRAFFHDDRFRIEFQLDSDDDDEEDDADSMARSRDRDPKPSQTKPSTRRDSYQITEITDTRPPTGKRLPQVNQPPQRPRQPKPLQFQQDSHQSFSQADSMFRQSPSQPSRQDVDRASETRRRSSGSNSALSARLGLRESGSSTGAQVYKLFVGDDDDDDDEPEDTFRRGAGRREVVQRVRRQDAGGESAWEAEDGDADSVAVLSESLFDLLRDQERERGYPRDRDRERDVKERMQLRSDVKDSPQDRPQPHTSRQNLESQLATPISSPRQTPQPGLPDLARPDSFSSSVISSAAATAAPSEAWGPKTHRGHDLAIPISKVGPGSRQEGSQYQTKGGFETDRPMSETMDLQTGRRADLSNTSMISEAGIVGDAATLAEEGGSVVPPIKVGGLFGGRLDLKIDIEEPDSGVQNSPSIPSQSRPVSRGITRPTSRLTNSARASNLEDSDSLAFDSDISPAASRQANPRATPILQRHMRSFQRLSRPGHHSTVESSFSRTREDEHSAGDMAEDNASVRGSLSGIRRRLPRRSPRTPRSPRKARSPRSPRMLPRLQIVPGLDHDTDGHNRNVTASEIDPQDHGDVINPSPSASSSISPLSSARSAQSAQSAQVIVRHPSPLARSSPPGTNLSRSPFLSQQRLNTLVRVSQNQQNVHTLSQHAGRSPTEIVTSSQVTTYPSTSMSEQARQPRPAAAVRSMRPSTVSVYERSLPGPILDKALRAVAEAVHELKAAKERASEERADTSQPDVEQPLKPPGDAKVLMDNQLPLQTDETRDTATLDLWPELPPAAEALLDEYEGLLTRAQRELSMTTRQYWLAPPESTPACILGRTTEVSSLVSRYSSETDNTCKEDVPRLALESLARLAEEGKKCKVVQETSRSPGRKASSKASAMYGQRTTDSSGSTNMAPLRAALEDYAKELVRTGHLPDRPLPRPVAAQIRRALGSSRDQPTVPLPSRRFIKLIPMDQHLETSAELCQTVEEDIVKAEHAAFSKARTLPNSAKLQTLVSQQLIARDQPNEGSVSHSITLQSRKRSKSRVNPAFMSKAAEARQAKIHERERRTVERVKITQSAVELVTQATQDRLENRIMTAPVRRNILQPDISTTCVNLVTGGSDDIEHTTLRSFALVATARPKTAQVPDELQSKKASTYIVARSHAHGLGESTDSSTKYRASDNRPITVIPPLHQSALTAPHSQSHAPTVVMAVASDPSFVYSKESSRSVHEARLSTLDTTLNRLSMAARQAKQEQRLTIDKVWTACGDTERPSTTQLQMSQSCYVLPPSSRSRSSKPLPNFSLHQQLLKGQGQEYTMINKLVGTASTPATKGAAR